jgi:NAD(P)-dependent dehydrogenase (short-subunit alcohol dehydrogenase family)
VECLPAGRDCPPCGWIGAPVDVANAALFLASDEARFGNAADLLVGGGRSQVYHD